jgi:hypothetical protein
MRLNHYAIVCAASLLAGMATYAETDAKGGGKDTAPKAAPAATESTINLTVTGMT